MNFLFVAPGRAHPRTEDLKLATGSGAHQRNDLIGPDSSDPLAGGVAWVVRARERRRAIDRSNWSTFFRPI
jgi:hypothetical protein